MAEGTVAADQLRLFIERIERLEEEKKAIADDIRDVYAEAKAHGYDTKTMRAIVRLRKMETHTRQETDALLDTYRAALGLALRNRAMAGHSKFKNIMYRKGAQDKKRSAMFSKLSPRDHRRGQDGPARSGHERAPARRGAGGQGAVDAQGQYPALDRQGVGRRRRELRGDPLRRLRPRRRRADRRGADRQPQPHRHQRPHRSSPRTAAISAPAAASATASSGWA